MSTDPLQFSDMRLMTHLIVHHCEFCNKHSMAIDVSSTKVGFAHFCMFDIDFDVTNELGIVSTP